MSDFDGTFAVWFDESWQILNNLGKRWGLELAYDQEGWCINHRDSKFPERYPSYSIALSEFLRLLERRMVDYTKPIEYKD